MKIEVSIDVSSQVSQSYKRTNLKNFPGTAIGMVSQDKRYKYSVFMHKEEIIKFVDLINKDDKKVAFCKIHSCLIYLCLENSLRYIDKINYCRDFKVSTLQRVLFELFPNLKKIKRNWDGGRGDKSIADSYANHIRKNPTQANRIVTAEDIKNLLARAPIG
jgi:hypothetical protein